MRKQMRRHMKRQTKGRKKEMEGKGGINIPYLSVIPTKKKEEDDITATI